MLRTPQVRPWALALSLMVGALLLLGVTAVLASPPLEPLNQLPTPPPLESSTPIPPTLPPVPTIPPLPTIPPGPTETPAPAGLGGGTGFLAILEGHVWEDGDTARPLADVKVRYTSDGVNADVTTDKRGYFKFLNVGPDDGVLDLNDARYQSGTGGVVIKPLLGQTVLVNLAALPKGKSVDSKVTLSSNASTANAAAGQTVTITLKVTNGTQWVVSGLMLGDQLPDGLAVAGVTTSRGDVLAKGPSVVAVDLNALAAGDSATVHIIALVKKDGASGLAANRATLLYREGPAVSAQATLNLAGGPNTLPVTGVGVPVVALLALIAILVVARRMRTRTA